MVPSRREPAGDRTDGPVGAAAPLVTAGVARYVDALTTTSEGSGATPVGASLLSEVELSGPQTGGWYVAVSRTAGGWLEVSVWSTAA